MAAAAFATPEFSMAIERANQARTSIEALVESVRSGERALADAFTAGDADPLMGRCFAVKIFEAVPGIGKVRARHTMRDIGLAEDIWLGDVPAAKRVEIMAALAV